jgi:(R,R)-butanediol dehydrogenase/meso-butanediol dehydrogenase/diacetyl reductase
MLAAVFHGSGQPLVIENVPDLIPADDQVILEVAHAGICGSDLHITENGSVPRGTILGHEFAGTIVELGGNVKGTWQIGDRVTALPITVCRTCEACEQNLPALCLNISFTGTNLRNSGAYAQFVAARTYTLQRLPSGVSFAEGAMIEPLAVAHHAVKLADMPRNASVLVIGAGPIGAGVSAFARHLGARHVIVSERSPARRKLALELGATHVIDPSVENVSERFVTLTGGRPQVVFECVGVRGLLQHAIESAGIRGRVVVVGVCFGEDVIKPLVGFGKEVSVRFSQCYTEQSFADVIDTIAAGKMNVRPMHTRTVGFSELPNALEALRAAVDQCKVLIDPNRS